MKTFVLVTRAFAVFSGIVLITSVIAQTSAAMAQTQENVPLPPARIGPPAGAPRTSSFATIPCHSGRTACDI
jgi:hypothetical protein